MKTRVKVEGLRELEKSLVKLEKQATKRTVARNALKAGGMIISDAARSMAPELEGDLKRSIGVGTRLTKRQRKRHRKLDPVEVFVGAGGLSQATQQEFGNVFHPAQPFMRPAWDAKKNAALVKIKVELGDQIIKAAKRLAKRKARR